MKVLIIDNYDSFTFNLYQYVGELLFSYGKSNVEVLVRRNDEITLDQARELKASHIIISPGPGTPEDKAYFGVCAEVITELGKQTPVLGVCLGMQGITHCFGGKIIRAKLPMHGKVSPVRHDGNGVYWGLPQNLEVMRYHSLMADPGCIPDCLEITSVVTSTASGEDCFKEAVRSGQEIMGVRHKHHPIEGIQFHPESFATEGGQGLLKNFLGL